MIAEEYEDRIIEEVENSAIKNQTLKDDLIDHFCCLVEIEMDRGLSFEKALEKAYLQTAPNGLEEIQRETIFLLNYSKIMFMKRLMYVVGYLFTVTWMAGIAFKLLHLAGAGVLLSIGALGLAFIFIPMFLINRYKNFAREVLSERLKWIFGGISFLLLVTSITMKLLHLMGAGLMLGLSFLIFGIGFLPFLFFTMYKKSVDEL
ncbi:hypothetical protein SAMN05421640_2162 [Ekhidna lutea]|uniref:Uncharacterized protein n=1 Tax=Ekhidna lutea TaxID=447679 RepID=A0A239JHN6_EKHLU|nr:hypothetical protein [Ekhidna lutea]SNT04938.1 hypothetical protein SAMN05421640_2162 [Ekhidna lutea]